MSCNALLRLTPFSRYVVGWMVSYREFGADAAGLISDTCLKQEIASEQLTLRADNGSSMTSKTVGMLLADLGVTKDRKNNQTEEVNLLLELLRFLWLLRLLQLFKEEDMNIPMEFGDYMVSKSHLDPDEQDQRCQEMNLVEIRERATILRNLMFDKETVKERVKSYIKWASDFNDLPRYHGKVDSVVEDVFSKKIDRPLW